MKIRIKHILIFFWLLILIFRAEVLLNFAILWTKYLALFFTNFNEAIQFLDLSLIDPIVSISLLVLMPLVLIFFKKKLNFVKAETNFPVIVLLILFLAFFFAPIITNENPDFQKDLKVTKLLSPFSTLKVIHLKSDEKSEASSGESFRQYKDKIVKPSFDESLIFADKVNVTQEQIVYEQKGLIKNIEISKVETEDGEPVIDEKTFFLGTDEL